MKQEDAYRADFLVEALKGFSDLEKFLKEPHDRDRGLELLAGTGCDGERYVSNNKASLLVDCKTGALIATAAKAIIKSELEKMGVNDDGSRRRKNRG